VIVVDTSVWIDYFNNYRSEEAAYLAVCIADARELAIPGLVLTEILFGVRTDAEAARLKRVMSAFDLTPELERADYEAAAELYRACRAHGITPRSTIDCLIAQLCLSYGYELLARDRDFTAIARVRPLKLLSPTEGVQERARDAWIRAPVGEKTGDPRSGRAVSKRVRRRRAAAARRSSRA
jgi:predicted nucleic acid-binding protein